MLAKREMSLHTHCCPEQVEQAMEAAANFVGEAIPIINRETNQVISVITEGAIFDAYLKVQDTVIDMEKR